MRKLKSGRQNADYSVARGVQSQRFAGERGVRSETPAPKRGADHGDSRAAGAVFLGEKAAPE